MSDGKPYNPYTNAQALVEMFDVPDGSDETLRLATVHALLAIAQQLNYIHQRMVDQMMWRGRR